MTTFKMHITEDHKYAQHISFIYLFIYLHIEILFFIYLKGIPTEYSVTKDFNFIHQTKETKNLTTTF